MLVGQPHTMYCTQTRPCLRNPIPVAGPADTVRFPNKDARYPTRPGTSTPRCYIPYSKQTPCSFSGRNKTTQGVPTPILGTIPFAVRASLNPTVSAHLSQRKSDRAKPPCLQTSKPRLLNLDVRFQQGLETTARVKAKRARGTQAALQTRKNSCSNVGYNLSPNM